MIDRRAFVAGIVAAMLRGHRAHAESARKVRLIGLLSPLSAAETAPWRQAFQEGLREHGWIDGTNLRIEARYADAHGERLARLATELVGLNVDVIVGVITADVRAARQATRTIPIVMASVGDPVAAGFAESLARPGGNITGLTQMTPDLAAKRLELLKEVTPGLVRVTVLWDPTDAGGETILKQTEAGARRLGLTLVTMAVRNEGELNDAFTRIAKSRRGALDLIPTPVLFTYQKRIAEFAMRNGLPSIFHLPEFVRAGGLLAFGPDRLDLFRRAAGYVDKILRGARPADLPIEQPTKFELRVNLKTAKALGLTVPQSLLLRADEVVQ